jgi:hypothetical protein
MNSEFTLNHETALGAKGQNRGPTSKQAHDSLPRSAKSSAIEQAHPSVLAILSEPPNVEKETA